MGGSRMAADNRSWSCTSAVLCKFDRGNRPPSIMALHGDAQAVKFIKPELLDRAGLSVRQYHGLADKLGLRLFKRTENSRSTELHGWHGCLRRAARLSRRGVGLVRLCVQTTALRNL